MKMSTLGWIAFVIVMIGALNWGLIGFFGFDLVGFIFGSMSFLSRTIYVLVAAAALYMIYTSAGKMKMT